MKDTPVIINRRAKFEYLFLQKLDAGIMLTGTEVKSLRLGNANLSDAYCLFHRNELILKKMYIAEYEQGNIHNHEPRRDRKLLLKKQELRKLEKKMNEKGLTIIPYKVYFNDRGLAKIEIALAKGKKIYDKRESIKDRDMKRDVERNLKS
jgi:SsrA-binding protein